MCTKRKWRNGSATVEFALVLPLLFIVTFASLEFARANLALHTLEGAAYEGARRGIVPGATATDCESAAISILGTAGMTDASITVTPTTIIDDTESVTVSISVSLGDGGWVAPIFFKNRSLTRSYTLARERIQPVSVP